MTTRAEAERIVMDWDKSLPGQLLVPDGELSRLIDAIDAALAGKQRGDGELVRELREAARLLAIDTGAGVGTLPSLLTRAADVIEGRLTRAAGEGKTTPPGAAPSAT